MIANEAPKQVPKPTGYFKGFPIYRIEDRRDMPFPYPPEPEWEEEWKKCEEEERKKLKE